MIWVGSPATMANVVGRASYRRINSSKLHCNAATSSGPSNRSADGRLYLALYGSSLSTIQSRCCANERGTVDQLSCLRTGGNGSPPHTERQPPNPTSNLL